MGMGNIVLRSLNYYHFLATQHITSPELTVGLHFEGDSSSYSTI